jgi:hypothetical protein
VQAVDYSVSVGIAVAGLALTCRLAVLPGDCAAIVDCRLMRPAVPMWLVAEDELHTGRTVCRRTRGCLKVLDLVVGVIVHLMILGRPRLIPLRARRASRIT